MKLDIMKLPEQNKIMHSYNNNSDFLHKYFDYDNHESSYPERLKELSNRSFNRKGIAETVFSFMKPFGLSTTALKHIDELQNNAITVVGGQQAGVLTGPLYSVHKAITVILLAKKQREALGVPVIPLFWVAGEDHDINEINHVYSETEGRLTKERIQDKFALKLMASDAIFNQQDMASFVTNIFSKFGETSYTNALLDEVLSAVEKEKTFTGFFVRLMNGLFADEGLLFIDSAYKPLRELESNYFCMLINESNNIGSVIAKKEIQFELDGYGKPLEVEKNASHLFYVHETGRVLLSKRNGYFVNDSVRLRFTKEELLDIAKNNPSLLSNNVATRPIMQDLVFPVLAFVGGAGEIAYWAILKDAFHQLNIKMPIVVPRMSLTLVTRATAKVLKEKSFTIEDVMEGKVSSARKEFIEGLRGKQVEEAMDEAEKLLTLEYKKISRIIGKDEVMMQELLQKNLKFHQSQFQFLKDKSEEALLIKHEVALRKFSRVETEIFPNGILQERIFTPYVYLNEYGPNLIKNLLELPFEIDGTHKIIYL